MRCVWRDAMLHGRIVFGLRQGLHLIFGSVCPLCVRILSRRCNPLHLAGKHTAAGTRGDQCEAVPGKLTADWTANDINDCKDGGNGRWRGRARSSVLGGALHLAGAGANVRCTMTVLLCSNPSVSARPHCTPLAALCRKVDPAVPQALLGSSG